MRRALALGFVVACGGSGAATGPAAGPPSPSAGGAADAGVNLRWHPDSRKVDRIGKGDGDFSPDGEPDAVCAAHVEGPAKALFVVSTTEKGEPDGDYQADTLVAGQEEPMVLSLAGPNGEETSGLAVEERGALLNARDGSIPALGPGPHDLVLTFRDRPAVHDGIRLYVLRPDGSLSASPLLR